MTEQQFIFLAGHNKSGTSLLHEILRYHTSLSGLSGTGVSEDEGQHLQSVYSSALPLGGAGKYIFNKRSYMDENHPLATQQSADAIWESWKAHYDLSCKYLLEKSPPNLIRTRFLQRLFPDSKFVVILRHPLAVSYATQKWSHSSIKSLVEHSLRGYEIFAADLEHLNSVYVLRYEDFTLNPQAELDKIYEYIGVEKEAIRKPVSSTINDKYFAMWHRDRSHWINRLLYRITPSLENRANQFGYSLNDISKLTPAPILGKHSR